MLTSPFRQILAFGEHAESTDRLIKETRALIQVRGELPFILLVSDQRLLF